MLHLLTCSLYLVNGYLERFCYEINFNLYMTKMMTYIDELVAANSKLKRHVSMVHSISTLILATMCK